MREDVEAEKWLNQTETVWEHQDAVCVAYESNSRINMPALDGRSETPHPCMVSGERWTYAWPSLPPQAGDLEGDVRYSNKRVIICDNFHMYHAAKTPNVNCVGTIEKAVDWLSDIPEGWRST